MGSNLVFDVWLVNTVGIALTVWLICYMAHRENPTDPTVRQCFTTPILFGLLWPVMLLMLYVAAVLTFCFKTERKNDES